MPGTGGHHPLDEVIAEIARLQKALIQHLRDRRECLRRELSSVDAELAELTGEPGAEENVPSAAPSSFTKRNMALPELIAELEAAPDKTLNIRKANLEVKSIKALAKAHPRLLRLGGKGAWPTVTLLERAEQESSSLKPQGTHQDVFAFRDTSSGPQSS